MRCCWHFTSRCPLSVGAALHRTTKNVQQLSPSGAVRLQGASSHLCCADVRTHPAPIQHRHTHGQQDLPQQTQHGHEVHLLRREVSQVETAHGCRPVASRARVQEPRLTMCAVVASRCMLRTTDTVVEEPAAFQDFNQRLAIRVESVASLNGQISNRKWRLTIEKWSKSSTLEGLQSPRTALDGPEDRCLQLGLLLNLHFYAQP